MQYYKLTRPTTSDFSIWIKSQMSIQHSIADLITNLIYNMYARKTHIKTCVHRDVYSKLAM